MVRAAPEAPASEAERLVPAPLAVGPAADQARLEAPAASGGPALTPAMSKARAATATRTYRPVTIGLARRASGSVAARREQEAREA
jgi:hypothetical protein